MLVDEYDKPILDALGNPAVARPNLDFLCELYGIIKDRDRYLRFVFLTGVSKFSKAGLFSGLNNLRDIVLATPPSTATLRRCSHRSFRASTGTGSAADGYNWLGAEKVPFDILLLFRRRHEQFRRRSPGWAAGRQHRPVVFRHASTELPGPAYARDAVFDRNSGTGSG